MEPNKMLINGMIAISIFIMLTIARSIVGEKYSSAEEVSRKKAR
jgi:hypothetical protein